MSKSNRAGQERPVLGKMNPGGRGKVLNPRGTEDPVSFVGDAGLTQQQSMF